MIEAKIERKHLKNAEINESILASFINFRKKKNLHIQSKVSQKIDKKIKLIFEQTLQPIR